MNEYKITMPEGWKPRAHNNCDFCKKDLVCHKHFGICPLSRAVPVKEVEPLAVLADRKGCGLEIYTIGGGWQIELWGNSISTQEMGIKPFTDPTYKICEQSARAYLEGLDDKGGR